MLDRKVCPICGDEFYINNDKRKYCSKECAKEGARRINREVHKKRAERDREYARKYYKEHKEQCNATRTRYNRRHHEQMLDYWRNQRYSKKKAIERTCRYCGVKFMTKDYRRHYCSKKCSYLRKKEKMYDKLYGVEKRKILMGQTEEDKKD